MPDTTTCPTIPGVITAQAMASEAARAAATTSPRVPGRCRELRLSLGEVVRPHGDLLLALPLERHHLVRDLKSIGIDLVIAEDRLHLQLEELLAHLVGVEGAGSLRGLGVDEAPRVARRR